MRFPEFNWRRFFIAAGISLAVPLLALGVSQRAAACGGPSMDGGRMPPFLHSLNLSEAQREKVFELTHAEAPAMRDKMKAVRSTDDALRQLVRSSDYSESKARELADRSARAMADMAQARAKLERQVYDLLTPEQRKQVADMKPFGDAPMGGPRGPDHRGEHRPPPGR